MRSSSLRRDPNTLSVISTKFADSGSVFLGEEWRGLRARYRLRCSRGHEWDRGGQNLLRVARIECMTCRAEDAIAHLKEIATQSGGSLLNDTYLGQSAQYDFCCALGHRFSTTARIVVGGSWCAKCAAMRNTERQLWRDGGLLPIQQRARERGGECLSQRYEGKCAQYLFRCGAGHEWHTSGIEVMRKAWCPTCVAERARRPNALALLQQAAERQGGECLASAYRHVQDHYPFRCGRRHEWTSAAGGILNGVWCPTCRKDDRQQKAIALMHALATDLGGRCLSDAYIDNNTKLEWECMRGHGWWARPRQITSGNWCAECAFLAQIVNEKSRRKRRHIASRHIEEDGRTAPMLAARNVTL